MNAPIDCTQAGHLGPAVSAFLVYGVAGVSLLLLIGFAIWRAVVHRKQAREHALRIAAARDRNTAARAVEGCVVLDEGVPFAARIEVAQLGKSWTSKGRTYHSWKETSRRIDASPFHIRTDDGDVVRIEASNDALLCIPFERSTGDSSDRTIVAQVGNGQRVTVVGRVFQRGAAPRAESVYRGAVSPRTTVRTPRGGRLVIASVPVVDAFRRRMALHVRWALLLTMLGAVLHGGVLLGYHARQLLGQTDTATVLGKRMVRGSKSTSRYLSLRPDQGGGTLEEDATSACFDSARPGDVVEIVVVPGWPSMAQLGNQPTAFLFSAAGACFAVFALAFVYRRDLRVRGPWYLRKRVEMRGDGPANPGELPQA